MALAAAALTTPQASAEEPPGATTPEATAPAGEESDHDFAGAVRLRAAFGVSTDADAVGRALAEGDYLSEQEKLALDLDGRNAFQDAIATDVMPFLSQEPTYAGAYFDQKAVGELVVLLTERSAAVEGDVLARAPKVGKGIRFMLAKYRKTELVEAMIPAWAAWRAEEGHPEIFGVAVSTRLNSLKVSVDPTDVDRAEATASAVARTLGVPVLVVGEDRPRDTTCQDRDRCEFPLMPGVVLAKGDTTVDDCTLGMHVYSSYTDDVEFVTAGHCGFSGSNSWYHEGYHGPNGRRIGVETATLLGPMGYDIMRVSMEDNQQTNFVYDEGNEQWMYGWRDDLAILEGSTVYASRGHSDTVSIGIVEDADDTWVSNIANVTVIGLDTTLPSAGGDSGSPVWAESSGHRVAIGILNNTPGNVTLIDHCYEQLGNACRPYPGGPGNFDGIVEGDFTGDGNADLITVEPSGTVKLRRHTPSGWGAVSTVSSGWQIYTTFTAADFTGDGNDDVIAKGADGKLYLLPHTPAGFGVRQTIGNGGWNAFALLLATDFTGDGDADLVAQRADGVLWLYPHTPAGFGAPSIIGNGGWQNFPYITAADFTLDGNDDLVAVRSDGVMFQYGHTPAGFANPVQIGTSWQNMTAILGPDFTGNGSDDIVARREDGNVYLYPHTSGGFASPTLIATAW